MKILKLLFILCLFFLHIWVSADYVRNIDDEYKIHLFEQQATKILKNSKNPLEISQKYRKIIKEKLWARYDEIKDNSPVKSFNEYALYRLYSALYYESFMWEYSINTYYFKILENDYIRTISRDKNLFIDDNSIYGLYYNRKKIDYIRFYPVSKNIDTREFILENFYDEKYKWVCELGKLEDGHMKIYDKETYHFDTIIEYEEKQFYFKTPCWDLEDWTFVRISENLLIYIPWLIEYVGLDFSLIEIKK